MSDIPSNINGVTIEFSSLVNKSVDPRVVDALKLIVKTNIATSKVLSKLYISSANDQHKSPSRYVQGKGKAVDISRINDMKLFCLLQQRSSGEGYSRCYSRQI
ncbi:MAG: hypothetical protein L3J75_14775 [Methylococcaceae bacterium]|nr:hypothetical protein [Methylococcaceae bacterium]